MDILLSLAQGFVTAATPANLMMCLLGVVLGQVIGVLPGIGPSAAIALLLPLTYGASPTGAIIMFAGLYYGAQYGGTLTSVLINVPGESTSVMTTLDGYQMALQGRGGVALGIAATGSFIAGVIGTLGLMLLAPPLASMALKFGPPEYCMLVLLGLTALAAVGGSVLKGLATGVAGLLLGTIGIDPQVGVPRFDFGQSWLLDGIDFIILAVALFGVGEVLASCRGMSAAQPILDVGRVLPNREEWSQAWRAILRGSGIGFLIGVLPGAGATIASFVGYIAEKKLAKDPSRFGKGAIEGVAGPESANNAASQTSFIPLLTLGIPSNPVMALMIGAMIIHGIQPGPQIMTAKPDLFWGMIASMWVGNFLLVVLNLPLIGMWVKLLTVKYDYLYPAILLFCCIGVYSISNATMDVYLAALFGLIGYTFIKLECEPAPLLLGFVLGPMMEENLRRALLLSRGDPMVFLTRPISLTLLIITAILIIIVVSPAISRKRAEAFKEEAV